MQVSLILSLRKAGYQLSILAYIPGSIAIQLQQDSNGFRQRCAFSALSGPQSQTIAMLLPFI